MKTNINENFKCIFTDSRQTSDTCATGLVYAREMQLQVIKTTQADIPVLNAGILKRLGLFAIASKE